MCYNLQRRCRLQCFRIIDKLIVIVHSLVLGIKNTTSAGKGTFNANDWFKVHFAFKNITVTKVEHDSDCQENLGNCCSK